MRLRGSSLIFGRGWILLLPVVLAISWSRAEEIRSAHRQLWSLTSRYFGIQHDMREIRAKAMSRVKKEK